MNDTTVTVPVTEVTNNNNAPVTPVVQAAAKPARKSLKGEWGKVGAPPKTVKYPRGAFTITQLTALNPTVCELTLRNRTIDSSRGFKIVKKLVDGKKVETKVSVPQTLVRLDKNAEKETVGRPNFRYMSKAAFDANRKNLEATPKNVTTPAAVVVAGDVVA
jgi:hypothetical protein